MKLSAAALEGLWCNAHESGYSLQHGEWRAGAHLSKLEGDGIGAVLGAGRHVLGLLDDVDDGPRRLTRRLAVRDHDHLPDQSESVETTQCDNPSGDLAHNAQQMTGKGCNEKRDMRTANPPGSCD